MTLMCVNWADEFHTDQETPKIISDRLSIHGHLDFTLSVLYGHRVVTLIRGPSVGFPIDNHSFIFVIVIVLYLCLILGCTILCVSGYIFYFIGFRKKRLGSPQNRISDQSVQKCWQERTFIQLQEIYSKPYCEFKQFFFVFVIND